MFRMTLWSVLLVALLTSGCAPTVKPKDQARSHYKMGQSYLAGKDYTKALQELLEAEKLTPDDAAIQASLGEVYYAKRAYALSESHYKKSLRLRPDDPNVENNMAALYLDMQRWQDAALLFRKVADNLLFPYRVRALTGLGVAYQRDGDYIKAILAFNEALENAPNSPGIMALQGQTYMRMGKYDLACTRLEQVVRLSPDFTGARMMLGEGYMQLGEKEKAVTQFQEVANRDDGTKLADKARDYLKMLQDDF